MSTSRVGLWDSKYAGNPERQMYADPLSAELAGEWLRRDDIVTVEDWGCGFGGFSAYLGDWQSYVGVDGSASPHADFLGTGATMVDISLSKNDVDQMIADRLGVYKIEKEVKSNTQYGKEYIYFLSL